ncbi:multidrug transporter [Burkholderia sp. SFA1]|uniref:efflux RND transporter periplasmic adaptor subunit n=1 Tax=unclassified Caballeronia TaxID=2646786 RepID=UPI001F16FD75|nr:MULTISPECIES: efflux RND transporter periplasmic adaptor subunit [unclassified Caballeronia]MCE4544887.1 efflux RND transporter periplasmic adaptor subunit [Caballeronia sp. PC1]MCE4570311.1 efflux RND transporter periplasmic adaptor subunit [Caballeronia sp. CLC5]BBP98149.1 multidrug transporter [Burkholderia sp. SFA1]
MKIDDIPREYAPRPKRSRFAMIAAIASVTAVAALAAWWLWPKHTTQPAAAPVPVNAGHPLRQDFPISVTATGSVQALNAVDVKVRVDGQLQRVAFTEGQEVKAGQVLAQLDQGPLKAQLQQAEAAQRKDQASLDNARLDLERYSKLVGIGAATSQSVDTAKAQVASYSAMVAADAASVQNDRLQLGFTTLYAPFAGRVGMREADTGAIVHPSDATGIVTVTQMEPITVVFSVPQDVLSELLANQAKAPLPVHVTTRAGSAALADGKLEFIDSTVDPATGQIRLKASFANKDRSLWPGELVNARLLLRTDSGRIAVPSRAIVNTQNGPQVFVVSADGRVQLRPVETTASVDGMTEVTNGIRPEDLVVFDGQSRLNPGAHVAANIVPPTSKAPGSAS